MRKGQGAFEYMMLLAGILLIATVAFFLLRGTFSSGQTGVGFAQCKASLINVGACYNLNGTWNPDPNLKFKAIDFGVNPDCTKTGGGLYGTPWDVAATEDEFTCGDTPPTS